MAFKPKQLDFRPRPVLAALLVLASLFRCATAPGATYNVTHLNDDTSVGSLRWAVTQANSTVGTADTIVFTADLSGTLTLEANCR